MSTRAAAPHAKSTKKPRPIAAEIVLDPEEAARAAGLRYVSDRQPGMHRIKHGDSFRFVGPDGKVVRDKTALARIKSLVIPPAWTDVWITPHANGHLQCTGRDARGRKQSRYHPHWREVRDETKYERMAHFAKSLPGIRKRVAEDMARGGLPREKVLATVVRLMEETHIRVGNEEYARTNKSYGLTTMRTKHVDVHGATVRFSFQGKSRVHHTIDLADKRIARIVKQCSDLPGHDLFQYVDEDGNPHSIDSQAVNDYLREVTGEHFTAKDFRTWAGSVLCCDLLSEFEPASSITEAKKNVVQAIAQVAAKLGNTPSVCRKCYVHPVVLERYLGNISSADAKKEIEREIAHERKAIEEHSAALRREEQALVNLLQQKKLLSKAA
ncbi:topoisomerase IB [Terriglobus roseus DSM 18391]|uniref:DNA topoisomerase n=1 Tax=Terriglobus roseus (strain DSM 18391 / NRRL B-41598 / KBS 63) TaxID=926566 RepID=I3ZF07_TERRK|nr:DNA topoisomerase IB [Terriglobus roseus]AFL87825.1 topoisomerase IB [Terriglobus roseus DSM 18391]